MHRYGFLRPYTLGEDYPDDYASCYVNDFRTLDETLNKRNELLDNSAVAFRLFSPSLFLTGSGDTDVIIPFNPLSYMPSALLGISFNTGLDENLTYDGNKQGDRAIGIISDADLLTTGQASFDKATGSPVNNLANIPEINQRQMGTFNLDCSDFFSCIVPSPIINGYGNDDNISTNRYFDDRYNVLISNDDLVKLRPDTGPDSFFGNSYVCVDTGRAEFEVEITADHEYQIANSGLFNITMEMEGSVYPFQFLNTREIPKPLHMDHVGRNDPDSGFDVG
jgi:hypothetical protein